MLGDPVFAATALHCFNPITVSSCLGSTLLGPSEEAEFGRFGGTVPSSSEL